MATQSLETGQDKIQKISDLLRKETLEPAEEEATRILNEARAEAHRVIEKAEKEADALESATKERIAKERAVFRSSMEQGARQAVEMLRQEIETRLFDEELGKAIAGASSDPKVIEKLIEALASTVEREGLDATIVVGKDVVDLLSDRTRALVEPGLFVGGVQLQLKEQQITVDVSDQALREMIARYVRKDFRKLLFGG